jgi:pyruvate formate lyase activating enzyme
MIAPDAYGFCGVRRNEGGELVTYAYGQTISEAVDPIEKKPLYHFLPGSQTFSIAVPGCNFRCDFCQNWQISQKPHLSGKPSPGRGISLDPEDIVAAAAENACASIAYTYTEPTIFCEYALDTARLAQQQGIRNVFVSNGFMTAETIKTIKPHIDAANIDLKAFRDEFYRKRCGGRLKPVLEAIRRMREEGIWLEITTLIIPGANDSDEELSDIAKFISDIDSAIPWHISRFHPDYRSLDMLPTPMDTLLRAAQIGAEHGLRYIYPGNTPKETATRCFNCGEPLISRHGFGIQSFKLENGACPACRAPQAGVWG